MIFCRFFFSHFALFGYFFTLQAFCLCIVVFNFVQGVGAGVLLCFCFVFNSGLLVCSSFVYFLKRKEAWSQIGGEVGRHLEEIKEGKSCKKTF